VAGKVVGAGRLPRSERDEHQGDEEIKRRRKRIGGNVVEVQTRWWRMVMKSTFTADREEDYSLRFAASWVVVSEANGHGPCRIQWDCA